MDDVRRLMADLDRFLDQLLGTAHSSHLGSAQRDRPHPRRAQAARLKRLERYVGALSSHSGCASRVPCTCSQAASMRTSHTPTSGPPRMRPNLGGPAG
jgi:hypothetical protein